MSLVTIDETIYDEPNGCSQVDVGDKVNTLWGYRKLTLSSSDISHLLHGGCLYTDDGEYATIIALQRDSFNSNRDMKSDFTDPYRLGRLYKLRRTIW